MQNERIVLKDIEAQIRQTAVKQPVRMYAKHAIKNAVMNTYFGSNCSQVLAIEKLTKAFENAATELQCAVSEVLMDNSYNSTSFYTTRLESDTEFETRIKREAERKADRMRMERNRLQSEKAAAKRKIAQYQAEIEKLNKKLGK